MKKRPYSVIKLNIKENRAALSAMERAVSENGQMNKDDVENYLKLETYVERELRRMANDLGEELGISDKDVLKFMKGFADYNLLKYIFD